MIKPYGSDRLNPLFICDQAERRILEKEAEHLPSLLINSSAGANAVMLGSGYFTPLKGYMSLSDAINVSETLHTTDGLFWPVPIVNRTNDIEAIKGADRIALRDPNIEGHPVLAIQNIQSIEKAHEEQLLSMCHHIFRTKNIKHPGVATFLKLGRYFISGPIQVLNFSHFQQNFPNTFRTATEIRHEIIKRDWKKVVAFQTRNPMHRAHEELCKIALREVGADGVLIHMLLGQSKSGDIPASIRISAIRKMVDLYFPENTAMVAGYGFDMLYAGPREAVLHALFRQNSGCTDFIVGRDHAGIGGYYGAFDAQRIFDEHVPKGVLDIKIFNADHTAYSKKLNKVVMMRDVTDHKINDFVLLSGTKMRAQLSLGKALPKEIARPEISKILTDSLRHGTK